MRNVTVEEVFVLHTLVCAKSDIKVEEMKDCGIRCPRLLRASLKDARTESETEEEISEQYKICVQACMLLQNFLKNKPFYKRNKQTALFICTLFLGYNGYELRMNAEDLEIFLLSASREEWDIQDMMSVFLSYIHPYGT